MRTGAARAAAAAGLLLCGGGCGLVPSQSSCDGRPGEKSCTDLLTNRNNQLEATLRALCVGKFSTGLCDHAGALGGCQCDSCENGKAVSWYFPDADAGVNSADDVKALCAKQPFVAP